MINDEDLIRFYENLNEDGRKQLLRLLYNALQEDEQRIFKQYVDDFKKDYPENWR